MGKAILTLHMSLDGVVSDVESWMSMTDEMLERYLAYYRTVDAIVVGGGTYVSMAEYWQHAETFSDSRVEREIARQINDKPKYVLSRSPLEPVWRNSQPILYANREFPVREVARLKQETGNLSVESGVRTWQAFIRHDLFDDLWLFIHPVVVSGDKLFDTAETKLELELSSHRTYSNGVIELDYRKKTS
ncbi:dihydrofolate reductase family protein [Cohnella caldifontis]|uniref:dihydrofolate reductase family protein n=1 Tax=Cohnella caldifontis TaxID=3027471 RepID=UPI0023EDDC3B|nr:dihydrofolate reductase family protein [Cohnella sp. YIM B05605]